MSFLAPLLPIIGGALASTGVAAGANALFGGGGAQRGRQAEENLLNAPIRNINTPGFTSSLSGGTLNFQRGAGTDAALGGFRDLTSGFAGELGDLQGQVAPGFGRLTSSTRDIFGNLRSDLSRRRREAAGSLRQNLARRGVLGSSFGEDALGRRAEVFERAERDLSAQEEQAISQNILRELDVTNQIINQRFNILQQSAVAEINQLNFESGLARDISLGVTNALTTGAAAIANLEAERAANRGGFFQPLVDATGKVISEGIGSLFGGSQNANNTSQLTAAQRLGFT